MADSIRINPADNVAVAIAPLQAGTVLTVDGIRVTLSDDIPAGHKFALRDIAAGSNVIKYGYPIGHAAVDIARGGWVNEKSLKTNLDGVLEYAYNPVGASGAGGERGSAGRENGTASACATQADRPVEETVGERLRSIGRRLGREERFLNRPKPTDRSPRPNETFMGYRRANGGVGIRNEIWIIPTVGCVNGTAANLARLLQLETGVGQPAPPTQNPSPPHPQTAGEQTGGVDAIVAWPHNYGCSQLGDDHENTRRILADMVLHPNCGGALVLGLGCENNQVAAFRELLEALGAGAKSGSARVEAVVRPRLADRSPRPAEMGAEGFDPARVRFLETQKVEGDETQAALELLRELYRTASRDTRTPVPIGELRVGLKCGGSDGFSGITANPLLGLFSDWLVGRGGSAVLTEVPEMFGAETILMGRCRDRVTFDKTVSLVNDFKEYFISSGQPIYENPSPGNKAGGISTLEEKSLGCTQKCGSAPVSDVLRYGERLRERGLSLLSSPGNDPVAATALAAAGCQMVLFTTGRGTPLGTFVPTVKVSTNTPLAQSKPHWIDFDAGKLLSGAFPEELLRDFIACIVEVANGKLTNNESSGMRDIAILKTGVTM